MMERPSQQKRAAGLFFSLSRKFGTGEPYEQFIPGHPPLPFRMQQLRMEEGIFEIGIALEKHLITVLMLARPDEDLLAGFKPIVCIYGGKLCPQGQDFFYPSILRLRILEKNNTRFYRAFPVDEIVAELGGIGDRAEDVQIYLGDCVHEPHHLHHLNATSVRA